MKFLRGEEIALTTFEGLLDLGEGDVSIGCVRCIRPSMIRRVFQLSCRSDSWITKAFKGGLAWCCLEGQWYEKVILICIPHQTRPLGLKTRTEGEFEWSSLPASSRQHWHYRVPPLCQACPTAQPHLYQKARAAEAIGKFLRIQ